MWNRGGSEGGGAGARAPVTLSPDPPLASPDRESASIIQWQIFCNDFELKGKTEIKCISSLPPNQNCWNFKHCFKFFIYPLSEWAIYLFFLVCMCPPTKKPAPTWPPYWNWSRTATGVESAAYIFVSVAWWQNDFRETKHLLPPIHLAEVKVFQMFRGLPRAKPHPVLGSGWWLVHRRGHKVKDATLFCREDLEKVHTPETMQYTCVSLLTILLAGVSEWVKMNTHREGLGFQTL